MKIVILASADTEEYIDKLVLSMEIPHPGAYAGEVSNVNYNGDTDTVTINIETAVGAA